MKELSILLDLSGKKPIYEQIYEFIKGEIRSGKLEAQEKLPSTRALSEYLNISRSTVQLAYDQLLSEGYIEAQPCRGYFVLKLDGLYDLGAVQRVEKAAEKKRDTVYDIDFSPSGIELDRFPYNAWRRVSKTVLLTKEQDLFNMGHPQGDYQFRSTIARYLHESRGVNCNPENIILGAGNEYLLMLLDQIFSHNMQRRPVYAMENPAYLKAYTVLKNIGRSVIGVALDENGLRLDGLLESGGDVAYVTPSHQYPLGIVMSIGRRMELLSWANEKAERYIIEDDYDSEFRYRGKPIPALQGLDSKGKVVYIGTFSKSIAPGIRMSYLVLPEKLLESYRRLGAHYSNTVSRVDQNIVNSFIKDGYYERHLNKMRGIYKAKHDTLLNSLKKLGTDFKISGESAGLHVLLSTKRFTERQMIDRAAAFGVKVYPLSGCYIDGEEKEKPEREETGGKWSTIILGYARLGEEQIKQGIEKLAEAFNGKNM